jgi:hypothetical protein
MLASVRVAGRGPRAMATFVARVNATVTSPTLPTKIAEVGRRPGTPGAAIAKKRIEGLPVVPRRAANMWPMPAWS